MLQSGGIRSGRRVSIVAVTLKILCVFGRHAYGDPSRGESYEHANFLPALRALGHEVVLFDSWDRSRFDSFAELNEHFVQEVVAFAPDVIFCVLMSYELWTETLDFVRRRFGCLIMNWGTDDNWKYEQFSRFIAPHVDLYASTYASVCIRAVNEGFNNFHLTQWGASDTGLMYPLRSANCEFDVSFVGAAYGNRKQWIEQLRRAGIAVACFGHGWPSGAISAQRVREVLRGSRVSLNFSDSSLQFQGALPHREKQIKARLFEVPGAGGMLLTEVAPDLASYYTDGEEILSFRTPNEMVERVRFALENPATRDKIADAGHERTLRDHLYTARFRTLLEKMGYPNDSNNIKAAPERAVDAEVMSTLYDAHKTSAVHRGLRSLLNGLVRLFVGADRAPRAARRLLFEISWRIMRARTYSARGLPGRLFYRES